MSTSIKYTMRFQISVVLFALSLSGCSSDSKPGLLSSMGYHIGKEKVWLKSPQSGVEIYSVNEVVGADPKTFYTKTIANSAGQDQLVGFDATNVYWGYEKVDGADTKTFEYVGSEYFKDKLHAYHLAYRISDDVQHFKMYDEFAKDSSNVYFGGSVFSDDAANFIRVGDSHSRFYKDGTRCWYFIMPIDEADPMTIRYIGKDYASDDKRVFYQSNIIESADTDTFKPLQHDYSSDKNSVYLQSLRIEGADPDSFKVLNERNAIDKAHCFYNGRTLDAADPATFQLIDEFYSKDAKHVWINGDIIEGADPATFRVVAGLGGKSRDAKYEYDMAERVGN